MTASHGFELLRTDEIAELNSRLRFYRHVKSGAELLSVENDDENKVFGITFRTPPADSTGIAHILEHAVLGGSAKYPLKEPFVQLIKGSLKTFVNAFTYPDRTVYPVASQNVQDFYNLIDVYLDAVFHPLIEPYHLEQEGWHYELEDVAAPLAYKGVVFNEMKGVYSSPDSVLGRASQRSLFPDTPYGFDSGGDPAVIPELTYAQFRQFHARYYHPSNAMIYMYGNDDPAERLRLLDAALRDFDAAPVDAQAARQPPFDGPRSLTEFYGVDAGSPQATKAMVQVNWMLPEGTDHGLVMALSVLSHALVSTPASPLRKALIDSGLGEDLTGGGLSTTLRQMSFAVGLKGVSLERTAEVEPLILDTLASLAADGIDPEMVEASLNTIEFGLRENNTGSFPRGLSLMLRGLRTWTYGGDPVAAMAFEAPLAAAKAQLAADPAYLQSLMRKYLVGNPHRTTVHLRPDADLNQRREAEEKAKLAAERSRMSEGELAAIVTNTAALRERQNRPDAPEALAALPSLALADLDKEIRRIPLAETWSAGSRVLVHDLFTNGIVYLDLAFPLRRLPAELLPYVSLFGRSLVEMGTEAEDFVKLSQRIGRKTGGIYATSLISARQGDPDGAHWFVVRAKSTAAQAQEMLDILHDILLTVRLDNRERFRQIVLKAKAGMESALVPSGHSVVNGRLRAAFHQAYWVDEQVGGVDYLFFLRRLAGRIEQDWPGVLADLEAVRGRLINRHDLLGNVTVDGDTWARCEPQLATFLASLPAAPRPAAAWAPPFDRHDEGLVIPAQVNYVGKGANLYELGYQMHGSIHVITNYLRTSWLWDKIRAQGGAYGAMISFSKQSGVLTYLSYRDPNLLGTLENYDGTARFLRSVEISDDELTKSIIGAIGAMDAYQLPDAKGYTSLVRHLLGESDEERQRIRDQVLATTVADFRRFADVLDQVAAHGRVVVMGSQPALAQANAARADWLRLHTLQ